jgi:hypothetical protein
MDLTLWTIVIAATALAIGGLSKGILGVGLPMVATPILSTFAPIPDVVAVMYFPIFATNFYQALAGGHFTATFKRFWPMLLVVLAATPVGTFSLVKLSAGTVSVLLGIAVAVFAGASLARPSLRVSPGWERPISLGAGVIGGFFGGMVLIGGPPVIMMMVALHLKKEEFIGAMGLVYLTMLIPAGFSLVGFGVLTTAHVVPGLISLIPVGAALFLGQWVRGRIDEERFRKVLLISMVLIGLNLFRRGLF